jgi:hypothetical protein
MDGKTDRTEMAGEHMATLYKKIPTDFFSTEFTIKTPSFFQNSNTRLKQAIQALEQAVLNDNTTLAPSALQMRILYQKIENHMRHQLLNYLLYTTNNPKQDLIGNFCDYLDHHPNIRNDMISFSPIATVQIEAWREVRDDINSQIKALEEKESIVDDAENYIDLTSNSTATSSLM